MCNLLRAGKVEGTKIALHCGLLLCYLVIAIFFQYPYDTYERLHIGCKTNTRSINYGFITTHAHKEI